MKKIDVQDQPVLSPGRVFQIAVTGVKYRLFRAAVTVAVIVVAMAFLMNILTESLIKRAVAESVREQIEELHRVELWVARLSMAQSPEAILRRLTSAETDDPDWIELQTMSGMSSAELEALQPQAREAVLYLNFFERLDFGRRRVLVGPVTGTAIFDRLQDEAAWHQFQSALADMLAIRLPLPLADFQTFLTRWDDLQAELARIQAGQEAAYEQVREAIGELPVIEALRQADGEFGAVMRAAGYHLTEAEASAVSRDVDRIEKLALVEATINNAGIRQAISAERDVLPGDVTMQMIWRLVRNPERAEWFIGLMRDNELDVGDMTGEELVSIAEQRAHTRLLTIAEQQTMEAEGGLMGIGARMTWLAIVSMLVCAVGIANAMLMSVTERFREIATLKCLGALDAFIMNVFLIEAGLLGLVGGLGGAIAGLLLATSRMALTFRSLLWPAFPGQDILIAGLISIGVGMFLAAISAVYPSFRAARLAPMEAMRIE